MSSAYHPQSAADTVRLIEAGVDPWRAIGQFVDDWNRSGLSSRVEMCSEAPMCSPEHERWGALVAASVDWLCRQSPIPAPAWVGDDAYRLKTPWFLYPGWRLRAWQLIDTPVAFKSRNIFGGDLILSRV